MGMVRDDEGHSQLRSCGRPIDLLVWRKERSDQCIFRIYFQGSGFVLRYKEDAPPQRLTYGIVPISRFRFVDSSMEMLGSFLWRYRIIADFPAFPGINQKRRTRQEICRIPASACIKIRRRFSGLAWTPSHRRRISALVRRNLQQTALVLFNQTELCIRLGYPGAGFHSGSLAWRVYYVLPFMG
jgi:hypothetical protein